MFPATWQDERRGMRGLGHLGGRLTPARCGTGLALACALVFGLGTARAAQPAAPSGPAAFSSDIYSMAADGSNRVNLTPDAVTESYPDWSLDGQRIVYSRVISDADLWVMNADGSGQAALTDEPDSQD